MRARSHSASRAGRAGCANLGGVAEEIADEVAIFGVEVGAFDQRGEAGGKDLFGRERAPVRKQPLHELTDRVEHAHAEEPAQLLERVEVL